MKKQIFIICSILFFASCGNDSSDKEKELELKEKELELKERELALKASQNSSNDYASENGNSYQNNSRTTSSPNTSSSSYRSQPRQKTEDELRAELNNKEKSTPKDYLSAKYSYWSNLAANTIVEGNIFNSATLAGFKNVKIKVNFYSKTDVLLGSEIFTVMEFVPPGGSASFRHKIVGWWSNVAASRYTILSAQAY